MDKIMDKIDLQNLLRILDDLQRYDRINPDDKLSLIYDGKFLFSIMLQIKGLTNDIE